MPGQIGFIPKTGDTKTHIEQTPRGKIKTHTKWRESASYVLHCMLCFLASGKKGQAPLLVHLHFRSFIFNLLGSEMLLPCSKEKCASIPSRHLHFRRCIKIFLGCSSLKSDMQSGVLTRKTLHKQSV